MYCCGSCTLQYAEAAPGTAELPALYGERYFNGAPAGYPDYLRDEPVHRRRAGRYLDALARLVPAPGRLLDVGCATGFFLDEARSRGWRVVGSEVSEWAAASARDRLALDVRTGPFPDALPPGERLDVVTFFNVLEQLPRLDAVFAPIALPQNLAAQARSGDNADPYDPIFRTFGDNYLKIRLRSHRDVALAHYADILPD